MAWKLSASKCPYWATVYHLFITFYLLFVGCIVDSLVSWSVNSNFIFWAFCSATTIGKINFKMSRLVMCCLWEVLLEVPLLKMDLNFMHALADSHVSALWRHTWKALYKCSDACLCTYINNIHMHVMLYTLLSCCLSVLSFGSLKAPSANHVISSQQDRLDLRQNTAESALPSVPWVRI